MIQIRKGEDVGGVSFPSDSPESKNEFASFFYLPKEMGKENLDTPLNPSQTFLRAVLSPLNIHSNHVERMSIAFYSRLIKELLS